jgi:hypothetical protein
MKKLNSLLGLMVISFTLWAQVPQIDGTYLPVPGTVIRQVYDTVSTLSVPTSGSNQLWDYSNQFVNANDTFFIRTYHPDSTKYASYANGASFATFLRSPFSEGDSVYTFYKAKREGFYAWGGFDLKAENDTVYYSMDEELVLPFIFDYGQAGKDTSKIYAKLLYQGYEIKAVKTKIKSFSASGYGVLSTPLGSFNNVLMAEENVLEIDSVYIKVGGVYYYNSAIYSAKTNAYKRYHFLRNNPFATSHLMMLQGDTAGTEIKFGWFTLPTDFGHIKGICRDSVGNKIMSGMAYLYREHGNFTKDDILARADIDSNGNYQFDTIPYGKYRIATEADSSSYPSGLLTFYGDTSRWNAASVVSTSKDTSGVDITMQFHPPLTGAGKISGNISQDWDLYGSNKMKTFSGDPIPGIDIIVEKDPGAIAVGGDSNVDGDFSFEGLVDGDYTIFVNVPGLEMTSTYSFTISGNTVVSDLDFTLGADSVYPNSVLTGVKKIKVNDPKAGLFAYPNPYKGHVNIKANMEQRGEMNLEVFDIMGKKITTIENSEKEQGEYSYKFSAKELGLSSGMYVIKLTTPSKTTTLKIIEY